jgi:hypothetical protein
MQAYTTTVTLSSAPRLAGPVSSALQATLTGGGKVPEDLLAIAGQSGRKYRQFVNTLVGSIEDARYLEVGTLTGSTLCSAIYGNKVTATTIDNWSQFGGPKEKFARNLQRFKGAEAEVTTIDADFRAVDFGALGKFNVYLFDGPHTLKDQSDGVELALPALDEQFVLIVDDWNWKPVRLGTMTAIERLHLEIGYMAEIRTTLDGSTGPAHGPAGDWHNGYCITVLSKA